VAPILLGLALFVSGGRARADEGASARCAAGDACLAAKDWPGAEAAFRKVLASDHRCWPAHEGLARALLQEGKQEEAVRAWRLALRWADAADVLTPGERKRLAASRAALEQVDKPTRELDGLLRSAATDLAKLGKSTARHDAELGEALLRKAQRLDPGLEKATEALAKMHVLPSGQWESLYHGRLSNWGNSPSPPWDPRDADVLACDGRSALFEAVTADRFSGDFDLGVDLRVAEQADPTWTTMLEGIGRDPNDRIAWGFIGGKMAFVYSRTPTDATCQHLIPLDYAKPPIDPAVFNHFELRFRKRTVEAFLNGRFVDRVRRTFDQHCVRMGLRICSAKSQFRNMKVRMR